MKVTLHLFAWSVNLVLLTGTDFYDSLLGDTKSPCTQKGLMTERDLLLPKTEAKLKKLGYTQEGIAYMLSQIRKPILQFEDPEEAMRTLEDSFQKVNSRFGLRQFARFIKDIDPSILHAFDPDFDPLGGEREYMTAEEIRDFEVERNEAIRGLIAEQRKDYARIAVECESGALNGHHYVTAKPHPPEKPLTRLPYFRPVPIGGQPGYRRRRHRS
jgi:hypothetical protein